MFPHSLSLICTISYSLRFKDGDLKISGTKKVPVHLVLTQDHRLPRSITISAKRPSRQAGLRSRVSFQDMAAPVDVCSLSQNSAFTQQNSSSGSQSASDRVISPFDSDAASSATSICPVPEYPRLLLSIRISQDVKPQDLSAELFAGWLGTLPIAAKSVRVEAGFASDSTLLMISMPAALLGYLPRDPAITLLGTTISTNLLLDIDGRDALQEPCAKLQREVSAQKIAQSPLQREKDDLVASFKSINAGLFNRSDENSGSRRGFTQSNTKLEEEISDLKQALHDRMNSTFRNVSACNRCRQNSEACDDRLPNCASCEKVGVRCIGYGSISGNEIPRTQVETTMFQII